MKSAAASMSSVSSEVLSTLMYWQPKDRSIWNEYSMTSFWKSIAAMCNATPLRQLCSTISSTLDRVAIIRAHTAK